MQNFWTQLKLRLTPFADLTVWVLLLVSILPLLIIDPIMIKTLIEWNINALAFAGITVFVSLMLLADVDLSEFVEEARSGNVASAIVVFGVCVFMAIVFLALVLWAKA